MKSFTLSSFLTCCAAAFLCLLCSCSSDKFPVTFHLEADSFDNDKMSFPYTVHGKEYKFQRAGMVGSRDIESYRTFNALDGNSFGVGFYLTPGARNRYDALFKQNYGKLVVPMANGHPCEVFRIDHMDPQGIAIIHSGITADDLKLLKKVYKPHEEEKKRMEYNDAQTKAKIEKLQ